MKKKLIISLLIGAMLINNIVITYAEPEETTTDGDFLDNVITSTKKDDINTCQVSFSCKMPEYFNLASYVQFMNEETDEVYQIIATYSNSFNARMYVPEGDYVILACEIYDDKTNEYPMTQPEDFHVDENGNHTIVSTLINYDEIEAEANRRINGETELIAEEEVKEEEIEETISEEETPNVLPWREFTHKGDGGGTLKLEGYSLMPVDLVVKITASGSNREGEFQYSTDNGISWSKIMMINGQHLIYLTDEERNGTYTGLTVNFLSSSPYLIYDEYYISTRYEYEVKEAIHYGKGSLAIYSNEKIYDENYNLRIKITKTGILGEGRFQYTLDYNTDTPNQTEWSEEIVIPESGIYEIPKSMLKIEFYDGFGPFGVGDEYTSEIETEKTKRDYTPYIIGLLSVIGGTCLVIVFYLLSLKERASSYTLNTYEKVDLTRRKKR